jgi:uncharacterized protein
MICFFVSDLHGRTARYEKLFMAIEHERPVAVFIGGDLLAHGMIANHEDFFDKFLFQNLRALQEKLAANYPRVFVIMGNDDPRSAEENMLRGEAEGLWQYAHQRKIVLEDFTLFGYAYVPPTPFLLKDWERYDVSRFVDPGSVCPEEGRRTVAVSEDEIRLSTIQQDLETLSSGEDLSRAIFLFHSPPYQTKLDRAALDGKMVDHVPLDLHVGSIAIKRFIAAKQPWLTLHGHVHESARLTGNWRDQIGKTHLFGAAHDGPELALARFDVERLEEAARVLI